MKRFIRIGHLVKQYGPFSLYFVELGRGERIVVGNRYEVIIEPSPGERVALGSVQADKSTLSDVIAYIREWLKGQYIMIMQMQKNRDTTKDEEERDSLRIGLENYQKRFQLAEQALRDLVPAYVFDPSVVPPPRSEKLGEVIKRYGDIVLRENIEMEGEQVLPISRNVVLIEGPSGPLRLGTVNSENTDLPYLLHLAHEWIEANELAAQLHRERLQEEKDEQEKKVYRNTLTRLEMMLEQARKAVNDLERNNPIS